MDRKIGLIILGKEEWENPRKARKQLLFEALLRYPEIKKIIYVNPLKQFWKKPKWSGTSGKKLYIVNVRMPVPGERYIIIRHLNRVFSYWAIRKKIDAGMSWFTFFYNPMDLNLAKHLKRHGIVFFDWTENWADYYSMRELISLQEKSVKFASGIITVSSELANRAIKLGRTREDVLMLPNATGWNCMRSSFCVDKLEGVPAPRIGYAGQVGPWFDNELVASLAYRQPKWQWVIIGALDGKCRNKLSRLPNVHLMGQVRYDKVKAYLSQCQVLVAPYKEKVSGDATKLYDYLCTGLPIVSSKNETSERLQNHIKIASGSEEWLTALSRAMREDDQGIILARQTESRKHTWDMRASKLLEWLNLYT